MGMGMKMKIKMKMKMKMKMEELARGRTPTRATVKVRRYVTSGQARG
jgi:hypothetical protein